MAELIGQTLSHYCVLEKIGSGGMGVVYRAHDERLDRDVALKILRPGSLIDDAARKRFHKEALTFSKLSHSNIAHVYDFDTVDGTDFLVMEYVPGSSLADKIAQGALPETEAVELGLQIARCLQAAHEQGIVHRDLKPGNIMVTPKGEVKLLDFGLAKLFKASGTAMTESLSEVRELSGTLPYMAPEHLQGLPTDLRSDIWAAGVVLFEMAAGHRPFNETQPARLIETILHSSPRPPAEFSPGFKRILSKCLEKERRNRYRTAQDLASDLQGLQMGVSTTWIQTVERVRRSRRAFVLLSAAGLVTLVVGKVLGWWDGLLGLGRTPIRSLAVLPFENLSKEAEESYFAQGMTDALINEMSRVGALRVISRTSVMQYKSLNKSVPQIAQELKVDAILEGSVLRSGNQVRITTELIDARADSSIWARNYEGNMTDVLGLQSEVAQAVVGEIRVTLTPQEKVVLAKKQKVSPEVYDTYLRAKFYLGERTPETLQKAVDQFERVIALDPKYALGYAGVADGYAQLGVYDVRPAADVMPKAKEAALEAIALDSSLADAYSSLALVTWSYEWNWDEAQTSCQKAISLAPGSAAAHHLYALYLASMGRRQESLSEIRRALSQDPLSPIINANVAWCFYLAHDYNSAIQQARDTLDLHPDFAVAHEYLGQAYAEQMKTNEAVAEFQQASLTEPSRLSLMAYAYGRSGKKAQGHQVIQQFRKDEKTIPAYYFAIAYAGLDEEDAALGSLEKSYEDRDGHLVNLKVHPAFERLHAHPRLQQLLRRMKLVS